MNTVPNFGWVPGATAEKGGQIRGKKRCNRVTFYQIRRKITRGSIASSNFSTGKFRVRVEKKRKRAPKPGSNGYPHVTVKKANHRGRNILIKTKKIGMLRYMVRGLHRGIKKELLWAQKEAFSWEVVSRCVARSCAG